MRFALALLMLCSAASGVAADRVPIAPGSFAPVLAPSPTENITQIAAFRLDRRPVTNGEFLAFVEANPRWRRDRVASLFADGQFHDLTIDLTTIPALTNPPAIPYRQNVGRFGIQVTSIPAMDGGAATPTQAVGEIDHVWLE